jgi:hypothetical protein
VSPSSKIIPSSFGDWFCPTMASIVACVVVTTGTFVVGFNCL